MKKIVMIVVLMSITLYAKIENGEKNRINFYQKGDFLLYEMNERDGGYQKVAGGNTQLQEIKKKMEAARQQAQRLKEQAQKKAQEEKKKSGKNHSSYKRPRR